MIAELKTSHDLSTNRACALVCVSKTAHYYQPKKKKADNAIKLYLQSLAADHKRWGFDKMMLKIKAEAKSWNHKRVHRIYCELGLNIRVKPRKRIPKGEAKALVQPLLPNICWSMDFVSDVLEDGRKFRTFNVIDDYNREALMVEPSHSLPAAKVVRLLDVIVSKRGYPEMIRVDNGPEFISGTFVKWAKENGVALHHIQPGKPAQNGLVERFNRTYREDILDMNMFRHLQEVRAITKDWLKMYNEDRPHESLAGLAPMAFVTFRKDKMKLENSILK